MISRDQEVVLRYSPKIKHERCSCYKHSKQKGSNSSQSNFPSFCTIIWQKSKKRISGTTRLARSLRLQVVPLSLNPPCMTRKKTTIKKMAAQNPGGKECVSRPQDFVRPFFPRSFLSRHAVRSRRKRDNLWSRFS